MTTQPAPARARSAPILEAGYAPLDAGAGARLVAAWGDLRRAISRYPNARYLAVETMKNQYRRTVLGPWWVTLQSAMFVVGIAVLFSQLQNEPLRAFLPFVSFGYMFFLLLSNLIQGAAGTFTGASSVITSSRQPLLGLALRDVTLQFLIFGHNAFILVALFAFGLVTPSVTLLLLIPLLAVVALNGVALACWLGPLVARYRDVGPAVSSVLAVLIFFTPVFYKSRGLTGAALIVVQANPLAYVMNALRDAALGQVPAANDLIVIGGLTAANVALAVLVFSTVRSRIPYWVS